MVPPTNDELASWRHPSVREVFRDPCLWVLDKPGGILSHPNPPARRANNALFRVPYDPEEEAYRFPEGEGAARSLYLVHRLDQETSGLILCAFDAESAAILKEALFHRDVAKEYRALLVGVPSPRKGIWSDCLEKTSRGGMATVLARSGKANAVTRYSVIEVFEPSGLALVSLEPETGRTHQLRVQTSIRGHPIAGDERYGDFTANRFLASKIGLKRMFLHAMQLELRHPRKGHHLRLNAPLSSRLCEPLARAKGLLEPVPRREVAPRVRRRR